MAMTATQTVSETSTRRDPRTVLPVLWVFAVLNYLYCDVLGLMHAPDLQGFLDGEVGGMSITTGFLLGAGVLMEIPIAMVLVSRLAPRRVARPATIVAGALMTLGPAGLARLRQRRDAALPLLLRRRGHGHRRRRRDRLGVAVRGRRARGIARQRFVTGRPGRSRPRTRRHLPPLGQAGTSRTLGTARPAP